MDLWSLGCTLYEIRLGRRLFEVCQISNILSKQLYLSEIASLLGHPPERWSEYAESSSEAESDITTPDLSEDASPVARDADVFYDKITGPARDEERRPVEAELQPLSDAEARTLANLLEKLMTYEPDDRPSVQDVAKHAWFAGP
jgi:serine/threonine protein kinase